MSVPEKRRKKNPKSCVFCRRSHLICDDQRPCARCVKRDIAHLCTDENRSNSATPVPIGDQARSSNETVGLPETQVNTNNGTSMTRTSSLLPQQPTFVSEHVGSEFSSLNEFLNMLEDPLLMNQSDQCNGEANSVMIDPSQPSQMPMRDNSAATPKEHFFLTAADPSTEMTPENRLKLVINAKLEAGLLQPYNYAQGYSRLQNYMDKYMNQSSKQRILKPLSTIRPAFRAIARSLKDVDLVLVEEGFERMLLSYDRVFTSMSMPACLWRRTGEIYRANKEFASLVDCTVDDLRDGTLAIYELMTEESAVNFWEKYGSIAFDKGQKAVLTSCNLRTRDGRRKRPCCFSFTIRRDRYNIPICIVGNFIPIS
ncbi:hypothetical protein HG537_0F02280 [Torulaspora globosa]|uniref:Zn(2)-C6 fungal-type domain-containing protein n=1 Tax=Torulaspora globosa TaxID=48254 RepID=A0A7H9HXE5_9SACH|nr:hypothetical protein HG537_0F02280 [Torulaspora sp. CBS 2947]